MLKRIWVLLRENRDKLFKVSRNAYMEREALLLERVDLLHIKEIHDDLQAIIDKKRNRLSKHRLRRHIEKLRWDIWYKNNSPFYLTIKG